MPLIECPKCHHRVSSVASACPECGSPVADRLWDEMRRGEYYRCGKCGEPVAVHASVCRNCGVPDPRRKRLRVPPRFAVAVGVAVVLLVAAVSSSERPNRSGPTLIPDSSADQSAVAAPDSVASPNRVVAARQDTASPRPVPRGLTAAAPIPSAVAEGQVRWTSTWANVRSGPAVSFPVVVTLNPDEMVVVDSLRGGWWLLLDGGAQVGYVANSVLRRSPTSPSSP
jgi:RNA polymerase subunit RPABC4/transcription elongation factor Spt4